MTKIVSLENETRRAERDDRRAARMSLAEWKAGRPDAIEDDPADEIFAFRSILFVDGKAIKTSESIANIWPLVSSRLEMLLDNLPAKHRLGYWRERVSIGRKILAVYMTTHETSPDGVRFDGVGFLGYERAGDEIAAAGFVHSIEPIDLAGTAEVLDFLARSAGLKSAALVTSGSQPAPDGYEFRGLHGLLNLHVKETEGESEVSR